MISAIILALFAQQTLPGPSLPPGIARVASCVLPVDEHFHAQVDMNTAEKEVEVTWSYFPNPGNAVGRTQATATYQTLYEPTAICTGGPGVLYVGGTRLSKTIVERWTFDVPESAPSEGYAIEYDRLSVQMILNTSSGSRRHVVGLLPAIGFDGVYALHHHDRELWLYRESTSTWTMAADATSVPHLDDKLWTHVWSRRHLTDGGVYVFREILGSENVLVLLDLDEDGAFDEQQWLDDNGWASSGYGDETNYY